MNKQLILPIALILGIGALSSREYMPAVSQVVYNVRQDLSCFEQRMYGLAEELGTLKSDLPDHKSLPRDIADWVKGAKIAYTEFGPF
jgi:hypothetical protein